MNSYSSNINKLNELHKQYPEKTEKELNKVVSKLEIYDETSSFDKIINNSKFNIIFLVIIFIIIALLGLLNLDESIYFFGFIFFVVGYCVGMVDGPKGFPIIFLFSHGMTGLGLMLIPIINKVLNIPILSDNPTSIYIYLGVSIALIIIATILAIIYNLSDYFKQITLSKLIPLLLYFISILMVTILPHIYTIIYNLKL